MNILTKNSRDRNSLRILSHSPFIKTNPYYSQRMYTNYLFPSETSNLTMYNSSNFRNEEYQDHRVRAHQGFNQIKWSQLNKIHLPNNNQGHIRTFKHQDLLNPNYPPSMLQKRCSENDYVKNFLIKRSFIILNSRSNLFL
jgi:hypothetical protein